MKNSSIKLSLIIPIYNIENNWENFFIKKNINSLTNLSIEIILIDDCSTDKTLSLLKSLNNDRIFVFRNKYNKGPNYSRNIGIENSNGKYILFLDSDDVLDIDNLSTILNEESYIKNDVTSFGFSFINNKNQSINFGYNKKLNRNKEFLSKYLLGSYNRVSWGRIYSSYFLKANNIKFVEDKTHGRDIIFCAEVFKYAKTSGFETTILTYSHSRQGSFSRKYSINNIISAKIIVKDMRKIIGPRNGVAYTIFKIRTLLYHYLISSLRMSKVDWHYGILVLLSKTNNNKKNKFNPIKYILSSNIAYRLSRLTCNFLKMNY